MRKQPLFIVLVICTAAAGLVFAQLTPEGRINGKVVDKQGNPLPGVSVQATSPKLIGKALATTDAAGVYRLMALPSGTYEVTYTIQGFKTLIRKGILLELSQTLALNVTLEEATIEEQVTVVGQRPLIDVKSTVKGQVMTKETYLTLPRGRSFDSLVSTIPGVQNENVSAGLSVDGASGAENVYFADGADVTNFHLGTKGQNVVLELLDEVKVTASGYNAEFGGSMGGVVNIITRSGGNEFHGDILGYYDGNSRLLQGYARSYLQQDIDDPFVWEYVNNDTDYFQNGKARDDYNRYELVFSLGGYFIRDKLWFFVSANPTLSQTSALRDFNYREGPFSTFEHKGTDLNGSVRLSAAPLKGLRISGSFINNFNKYRGSIPDLLGYDDSAYEWSQEGYDYPNWTAALTADYSAGNNLLISYRGGWHTANTTNQQILPPDRSTFYFSYSNTRYSETPFYIENPDLLHSSGWTDSGVLRETKRYLEQKISNNLDISYFLNWGGEHAFKAGFGYTYLHEDTYVAATHPRVYMGWGRTTYALGDPIGVGADPFLPDGETPNPAYGQYGYYYVRGSWTQPVNGGAWNIQANNFSAYLQDSWTIKNRLTLNIGLRAESQYIPSMTTEFYPDFTDKPIKFDMTDMLAPRLGVVYDVFGDSSLKIFGSLGIYYDVMKLYMAELTFGGWKRVQDYYSLNVLDYRLIAASGEFDDRASQEAGGSYIGSLDFLPPSFGRVDPNLKPTAQREISFGAEKKLTENLSLSARFVNKHLIRTIEDVGAWSKENTADGVIWTEIFYVCNPGYGWSLPESQGGKFPDKYADPGEDEIVGTEDDGLTYPMWPTPKATRDYFGLNIALEKRFSHNWQGGINYTLSRVAGNYSGLASSDEVGYDYAGEGRVGPNVELYYDDFFIMYDAEGRVLRGPLGQDRTHFLKGYGSYTLPFGLTVGVVAYGRSGLPLTSKLWLNDRWIYPENRGDRGRLPFTFWADLYLEYGLRIGAKARASINLQINNVTNTKTVQSHEMSLNLDDGIYATNAEILDGTLANRYLSMIAEAEDTNFGYNKWDTRFGTWSTRLGLKFSF